MVSLSAVSRWRIACSCSWSCPTLAIGDVAVEGVGGCSVPGARNADEIEPGSKASDLEDVDSGKRVSGITDSRADVGGTVKAESERCTIGGNTDEVGSEPIDSDAGVERTDEAEGWDPERSDDVKESGNLCPTALPFGAGVETADSEATDSEVADSDGGIERAGELAGVAVEDAAASGNR